MKQEISGFNFEGKAVRVVTIDGAPWWVGKDVCDVLGYENASKALSDHCKGITNRYPLTTGGGTQEMRVISEPDLFRLIVGSKLPSAVRFERWVFEEVLPSIRKTGGYLSTSIDFTDPDNIQKVLDQWKIDRQKRIEAEARVGRLIHNNNTFSTTEIAKELGMKSAQELNQKLLDMGVHYKDRRGVWLLNAEYSDKGFQNIKQKEIDGKKDPVYYAEWTGIGRDWLVGMFYNTVQS